MAIRTSGRGNDLTMVVLPAVILIGFATYFMGGPAEVFGMINTVVGRIVEGVSGFLSGLF
jgi:hypothetical protein